MLGEPHLKSWSTFTGLFYSGALTIFDWNIYLSVILTLCFCLWFHETVSDSLRINLTRLNIQVLDQDQVQDSWSWCILMRPKMKVLVSILWDPNLKFQSLSRYHETKNESLGLGLDPMRPKIKHIVQKRKVIVWVLPWWHQLSFAHYKYKPHMPVCNKLFKSLCVCLK